MAVGKEKVHYTDFNTVIHLFEGYGLSTELFTSDAISIHEVVSAGAESINMAVKKFISRLPGPEQIQLFNEVYDYLSEQDEPETSDFIFVFGSKTMVRPQKALELYEKEMAKVIILSGGSPIYGNDNDLTEAESFQRFLLSNNVPRESIILEDKSITVADNVRRTLNLLDKKEPK